MRCFLSTICLCLLSLCQAQQPAYASSTFSFPVSNLEASVAWYGQLLGEVESFAPAEGVVEFQLNPTTWLQLFEGETGAAGSVLRLEVTGIKQQHARLEGLGIPATAVELVPGIVSFFDFEDLDGNQLSFYQLE